MRRVFAWIAILLVGDMTSHLAAAANIADFSDYSLRDSRGRVLLPGRLFTPPEALTEPTSPRPLIVFLHGGGAIGTNNITQVEHTPDYLLEEAKRRGAFLYVPQADSGWATISAVDSVMAMIDRAVGEKNVDANRLYATGYSNGGGGTWNLLSRNSRRFAAALVISGVAPAAGFNAANLLSTAIITLHARDDATVPVARTRSVVNSILTAAGESSPSYPAAGSNLFLLVSNPHLAFHRELAASGPADAGINFLISRPDLDLIYFESPDGGHTGPPGAFFVPQVYDWMFAHSRAAPEPSTPFLALCGLSMIAIGRRGRSRFTSSLKSYDKQPDCGVVPGSQ
jgi:poly(3-hydroxybutyrate) depolymerase